MRRNPRVRKVSKGSDVVPRNWMRTLVTNYHAIALSGANAEAKVRQEKSVMQVPIYRSHRARRQAGHGRRFLFIGAFAGVIMLPLVAHADTPTEQYQFAASLYGRKSWQDAAAKLRDFIAANPNDKNVKAASYMLGSALGRAKDAKGNIDYTAAAAAYEKALQSYPDPKFSPVARFELADDYLSLKKYDKTIAAEKEFLKSNPAADDAAQAQYNIGESYYALQKPAEARAAYAKVVGDYSASAVAPYAQYSLGLIAADANQPAAAAAAFRAVTTKHPTSAVAGEARLRLADALLADKKYAEAGQAYHAVLNDAKSAQWQADAQLGLADAQFGAKDFAGAAQDYSQALSALKGDVAQRGAVQQRLADSYYNAKNYERALASYQPLTQSGEAKTAGYALYFSGNSLRALKRYNEAAAAYRKVLDNYPQHSLAAKSALRLGDTYADAKDAQKSLQAYKLVLTKYKGTDAAKEAAQDLVGLANDVANNAGQPGQATGGAGGNLGVEEILHALPPGAASSNAKLNLAQAAFNGQKWSEAASLAQSALDGNSDKGVVENALYLLGLAKLNAAEAEPKGDASDAATTFRSLLAKNPAGAMASQAGLGLTWALIDAKKWSDAAASARQALAKGATGETKDRLQLALGQALLRSNKTQEAAPIFVALSGSAVKDVAAQGAYGAAQVLEADKQWGAAAKSWGQYAAAADDAPTRAKGYLAQGVDLAQAKSHVAAVVAFDQAVKADPKGDVGAQALNESAWAAYDAKQTPDALARWGRVVTDYPTSRYAAMAALAQGDTSFEAKSWDAAAASYRIVTDKFPHSAEAPSAWYKLGSALYNQQNWSDAAPAFDKAAASPKSKYALESSYWAGESWRKAGKLDQARTRYATFIGGAANAPQDVKAYLPAARSGLGQALVAANDVGHAITVYQAGLPDASGADAADLNYHLGVALMQQGKYKDAYDHFLKVDVLYGNSEWAPRADWAAGQAQEKLGNKQGALDMYQQLVKRQPASDLTAQAQERVKALGAG